MLQEFGIDGSHLVNKHGPCPMCEGKDRFRFDDRGGRGTWFCNACGAGDGFDLIEKFTGGEFKAIAAQIDTLRGKAPEPQAFRADASVELKRESLNRLWLSGNDPSLINEYFERRGLTYRADNVDDVRGNREVLFIDEDMGKADFPAMLAMVRNAKGDPITIHRTYLLPNGMRVKKLMTPTETITGGAIRLRPIAEGRLLVAEGIETALAGQEITERRRCGVWATVSANGMKNLEVPVEVEQLIICADNDKSFTGQAAAFELARRVKARGKCEVRVVHPNSAGDMADLLNEPKMNPVIWRYDE